MSAVLIIAVAGLVLGLIFFAVARSSASLPTSPLRWQTTCVERGPHCGKKPATYHHGL
nr:MAG TPA: hypothetical protein [Caudoviricetes sp.]